MFSKLKRGVKWIMKEVKKVIDDSFTKEVYNNLRDSFYDKDKSKQIGVVILFLGVGLILKNFV